MTLNDSSLPLPGRELDVAVWRMLGHEVEEKQVWSIESMEWEQCLCYCAEDDSCRIVPAISTTHAYHSVMEAVRRKWAFEFEQMRGYDADLCVVLKDTNEPVGTAPLVDTWVTTKGRTLEAAYAHAVCAAAWKTMGGEGD